MTPISKAHRQPDWLDSLRDRMQLGKTAMRSEDINALAAWDGQDLNSLRLILGNVFSHLNEASNIFNYGSRSMKPQYVQRAGQLLPDLQNLPQLKANLQQTSTILAQNFAGNPQIQVLQNMIHAIQNASFTPQQEQALAAIASGNMAQRPGFVPEADPEQMVNFLKQRIYGQASPEGITLKVIRECLQNACDAAIHPQLKAANPAHVPTIQLQTHQYKEKDESGNEKSMLDIVISDNGIGMDWAVLSDKFFRYFESGKGDMGGISAGGFGIAKALIQETPQHGWAVDTNGLHSSRFGRNMYMGTPTNEAYQPPQSQIQQNANGGTSLSLFGLAMPYSLSSISDLCKNYAIGQVQIFFNGAQIQPRFTMEELKPIGGRFENVAAALAENPTEANVINEITQRAVEKGNGLGNLNWEPSPGKRTSISFAMKKMRYGGELIVLVNNQFQFTESKYFEKADLICNVQTNLTPKDEGYPIDPGRVNLTDPYKEAVQKVCQEIGELLKDISRDELFKEGLDISIFNKDMKPLSVFEGEEEMTPEQQALRAQFEQINSLNQPGFFKEEKPVETPQEVAQRISAIAQSGNFTPEQRNILTAAATALQEDSEKRVNVRDEINKIIEGLTTPASMIIQKNYVSKEAIAQHPELTTNLILLWQSIVRSVVKQGGKMFRGGRGRGGKSYVPGIVFSNEALALYSPPNPKRNMNYATISINPMVVASVLDPENFEKKIEGTDEMNPTLGGDTDIMPVDKLTALLFHEAVHEVTHLMFPDYAGSYDEFHVHISKMERACHFLEPQIRKECKRYIKNLRNDMKKMITLVSKAKRKQDKLGGWVQQNCKFAR